MGAAEQIYFSPFDAAFYKLSAEVQARIESRLDDLGRRLRSFPHYHMTGSDRFRLRIGDYRIIYKFDLAQEPDLSPERRPSPGNLPIAFLRR